MPEDDRLQARFASFHRYSADRTEPPGFAAVRHAVTRRRRRRTLVAVVAVVLGVLALVLPVWSGPHTPPPGDVPSPSTSVVPSPSPSTSAAAVPAQSPSRTGSSSASPRRPDQSCPWVPGLYVVGDGGMLAFPNSFSVDPPDYFQRCPTARLRMVWATYGWSPAARQLVLSHSGTFDLTAAQPKGPGQVLVLPANADTCGYAALVARSDHSVPGAVPVAIQNAGGAEYTNWVGDAVGPQATALLTASSTALEVADGRCTPPASPSPSPTP